MIQLPTNRTAFEELLLTCCQDQGWDIERNFRYSGDGGLNGRVIIAWKLYLIQAKRYRSHINPQPIHDFHQVIQVEVKLRAVRQQAKAQRQRMADKYGHKFLALIDGNPNTMAVVIDIVQKLVVQDEEGNVISETDSSLVGKLIEVRFRSLG